MAASRDPLDRCFPTLWVLLTCFKAPGLCVACMVILLTYYYESYWCTQNLQYRQTSNEVHHRRLQTYDHRYTTLYDYVTYTETIDIAIDIPLQ